MLVLRVEIWPGGDRRRAREIARVGIANTSGLRVQVEGDWRKPLHTFAPKRHFPSSCKPCGRRRRHTTHSPLWWDELR